MAHKSFSDEKHTRKLHFSMSWVNSRCDRMLPSFFHWTLEIHLRLPSINELGSASQFPNTDVEKLKETQKTAFYLVCSGHRRRVASVLGVATLRLDYILYTTRHGLDQPIEQALGDAASHLIDVLHQLSSRLCLWSLS